MEGKAEIAQPVPLGIGEEQPIGPSPVLALTLAVLVAVIVFAIIWKVRKTFGMRE